MTSSEVALVEYAQRSARAARECADALVESRQAWERVEMRQDEQARDLKEIKTRLATLSQPRLAPIKHTSLTEEDFEDSPTGTHKLVSKRRFDEWARERDMSMDAKRWRFLWRKAWWLVLLVVGGAATMAGEQLLKRLLHL